MIQSFSSKNFFAVKLHLQVKICSPNYQDKKKETQNTTQRQIQTDHIGSGSSESDM